MINLNGRGSGRLELEPPSDGLVVASCGIIASAYDGGGIDLAMKGKSFSVRKLTPAIGAEVEGVDFSRPLLGQQLRELPQPVRRRRKILDSEVFRSRSGVGRLWCRSQPVSPKPSIR